MGRNHHSLGLVAMLVASALFAVMNVLVRVASDQYGLDSFKMGVFRFAIGLSLLGLAAMLGKINLQFVNSPILVLRGLLGGLGVLGLYLSITYLGVAKGTVVSYTYPVFAMIGSVIVLRETAPVGQWAGAAGAFAGIFLIASAKSDGQSAMAGGQWAWYLVAIVGAACAGMAVVLVRKLRSTDSSYAIFFSQCVMGLWLTVIPANLKPVELNLAGGCCWWRLASPRPARSSCSPTPTRTSRSRPDRFWGTWCRCSARRRALRSSTSRCRRAPSSGWRWSSGRAGW